MITFHLTENLSVGDYLPLAEIARAFATANDCVLEKIKKSPMALTMTVGIKNRLGVSKKNNPLLEQKKP